MELTLSDEALALLRCPETRQALRVATEAEWESAFDGDASVAGALICEDGSKLYPVREGLPVLLSSESKRLAPQH